MDIIVFVKRVPDPGEAELVIDRSGKGVVTRDMAFGINDWDNYALEEAVELKEEFGGSVTAITVGPDGSDEVLRHCLALGADDAVRVWDPALEGTDAHGTAVALAAASRKLPFDLILTGMMASDDADTQVGATVAALLGVSYSTIATDLEIEGRTLRVRRELEGGVEERLELELPALMTVQTGLNEPRYVPISGIRRAVRHEIKLWDLAALGLGPEEVSPRVELEAVFLPEAAEKGEMIEGSPAEIADRLAGIFGGKGWLR